MIASTIASRCPLRFWSFAIDSNPIHRTPTVKPRWRPALRRGGAAWSGEADDRCATDDEAVHGERHEVPGLEEADEEPDGEPRGDRGGDGAGDDLAVDAFTVRAGQVVDLVEAGEEDDGGGEQEGEADGILVRESADQA